MTQRVWRWLARRWPSPAVSVAWRADYQRREFSVGVDQVSVSWPIDKAKNESAVWNKHRLRKRVS